MTSRQPWPLPTGWRCPQPLLVRRVVTAAPPARWPCGPRARPGWWVGRGNAGNAVVVKDPWRLIDELGLDPDIKEELLVDDQSMRVQEFRDDDASYLAWIVAHRRGGYVINISRGHSPTDARLHHADCPTISGEPARGRRFVGDYVQVCAEQRATLDDWAIHMLGTHRADSASESVPDRHRSRLA